MLTKTALKAIKKSLPCRKRIATEFMVISITVDRWVKRNDIMLTTEKALNIISEETGLNRSEILERELA